VISTRPAGTDNAPNLVVLAHSSFSVIATAIMAPDDIRTIRTANREFWRIRICAEEIEPVLIISHAVNYKSVQHHVKC